MLWMMLKGNMDSSVFSHAVREKYLCSVYGCTPLVVTWDHHGYLLVVRITRVVCLVLKVFPCFHVDAIGHHMTTWVLLLEDNVGTHFFLSRDIIEFADFFHHHGCFLWYAQPRHFAPSCSYSCAFSSMPWNATCYGCCWRATWDLLCSLTRCGKSALFRS